MTVNPSWLPAHHAAAAHPRVPGHRGLLSGLVVGAAMVVLVGASAGTASAAPGDTATDTTTANVEVVDAISLNGLTPAFTLVGLPGATVTGPGEVTMNVQTNNLAGYAVTVQAATAALLPQTTGNPDSIPVNRLRVRETADGTGAFTALSNGSAVTVHTQATRSAEGGDDISNDFQVDIPFVNTDTYSTTLNYIATTL